MQCVCRAAEQIHSISNAMYLFSRIVGNGGANAAAGVGTVWAYSLLGHLGQIVTTQEKVFFAKNTKINSDPFYNLKLTSYPHKHPRYQPLTPPPSLVIRHHRDTKLDTHTTQNANC
jgi:hypothetical protein